MWEQAITAMDAIVRDETPSFGGSSVIQPFKFFSVKFLISEIEARFGDTLCGYCDTS